MIIGSKLTNIASMASLTNSRVSSATEANVDSALAAKASTTSSGSLWRKASYVFGGALGVVSKIPAGTYDWGKPGPEGLSGALKVLSANKCVEASVDAPAPRKPWRDVIPTTSKSHTLSYRNDGWTLAGRRRS